MPSSTPLLSSPFRLGFLGLSLVVLAACAAGSIRTVNYGTYSPTATRLYAAWAGSGGPLLIEMRNSPYAEPPQRAAEIIAASATGSYVLPGVTFTANPAEAWHPDWRIVYAFQVPQSLRMEPVCNPSMPLPSTQPPGTVATEWYALVVFCNGWQPIRGAGAWSYPVPGPDTPDFRSWASYTMSGLFPSSFEGADTANPMFMLR
jgi:hypothetical protein